MLALALLLPLFAFLGLVIPVARGADHQVVVGGIGVLKYDPEFVTADIGDTVTFVFKQKNHTVTQSTLESPCVQAADGFDSGFVPVPDDQTSNFTVAQFTVSDTKPVWVYCRQANHCQQGMVFAINPADKFDAFKSAATGTASSASSASVITVTATVTVNGATQTTTYATTTGAATTTASAPSASTTSTHVVTVGMNGVLAFSPDNLSANVGDTVTFRFSAKNHTVTQSSFAKPCAPLGESSANGLAGFDSGFMPVAANASDFPEFTITVNDTAPIWVYCKQTNPASHCQQGMVLAINAPATGNTFDAFLANAKGTVSAASSTTAAASGTQAIASSTATLNPGSNAASRRTYNAGPVMVAVAVILGSLL
ncbi:Cupredoxin [Lentinus tigrinus ALCF2SS1-7]|uniref:Cupredoxin n=1 Tax=Lentinus tigrinus ALCF2SS1-6 TaxID=1328759 RepID=A0A5C2S656_9APHY|nr:Cupredoxin [Lentinus tigrinus ALCF2SS1-6]RPD73498.1 Cupredoxin [Lentinus tigrinus ALCF2SS1-7]